MNIVDSKSGQLTKTKIITVAISSSTTADTLKMNAQNVIYALLKIFFTSLYAKPINYVNTDKERMIRMSFSDAVLAMKQGKRVHMPWWKGYWYIANDTLIIHCASGHEFNAFSEENADPLYTLSFMAANCWEIVPD